MRAVASEGNGSIGQQLRGAIAAVVACYPAGIPGNGNDAYAPRSDPDRSPCANRHNPARAIIAALSVASRALGACTTTVPPTFA